MLTQDTICPVNPCQISIMNSFIHSQCCCLRPDYICIIWPIKLRTRRKLSSSLSSGPSTHPTWRRNYSSRHLSVPHTRLPHFSSKQLSYSPSIIINSHRLLSSITPCYRVPSLSSSFDHVVIACLYYSRFGGHTFYDSHPKPSYRPGILLHSFVNTQTKSLSLGYCV